MCDKKRNHCFIFMSIFVMVFSMTGHLSQPAYAREAPPVTDSEKIPHPEIEVISP